MNKTHKTLSTPNTFDLVKSIECENRGVHANNFTRIAIGCVLSGTKYIHNNDHSSAIEEGDIFLLEAGFHYEENMVGSNGRYEQIVFFLPHTTLQQTIFTLNINFSLTFSSRHTCQQCMLNNFAVERGSSALRSFFQGVDISLRNSGLQHNDVRQRIKLNELIYLAMTGEDGCLRRKILRLADTTAAQFVNTIYDNLFNDISIEMLAEATNRSLTSFKKEFRRQFNAPPHRWIIEQRLMRARILLSSTNRTVSEIGTECAFANISHFIKLFKQRYHTTPAAFRHRHPVAERSMEPIAVAE
jgi:AraC-like DNA-binding protein